MKNSAIIEKINLFRNKFYLNLIIKGFYFQFFSINGFLLIVFLNIWYGLTQQLDSLFFGGSAL